MVLAGAGVVLAQEVTTNSTAPEQEGTTLTVPQETTSSGAAEQTTSSDAANQQYTRQHATVTGRVIAGGQRARPDLRVSKTVKPQVVKVGQKQTFTVKVTNQRGRTANNLKMTDPLPKNVRFVRATTSRHVPGSCTRRRQGGQTTVECWLGDLKVGRSVSVAIVVKAVKVGTYTNRAFVRQTGQDNASRNNKANQSNRAKQINAAGGVRNSSTNIAGENGAEVRVGGLRVIAPR
jgi:uncharacterized repeat protein (TIGR01451 family)